MMVWATDPAAAVGLGDDDDDAGNGFGGGDSREQKIRRRGLSSEVTTADRLEDDGAGNGSRGDGWARW